MSYPSRPDDLALHGVRVLGFPTTQRVAERYRLDVEVVDEHLLDFEATGWCRRTSFAGSSGWSLTGAGRLENEHRLADELDRAGARGLVVDVHDAFVPLNERFGQACTDWQIRPDRVDPLAFNDHTDWRWDDRVLARLTSLGISLTELCERLTDRMARFGWYGPLYTAALARAGAGQSGWIDASDRDSLHLVWIQFHEDLLATLGIQR